MTGFRQFFLFGFLAVGLATGAGKPAEADTCEKAVKCVMDVAVSRLSDFACGACPSEGAAQSFVNQLRKLDDAEVVDLCGPALSLEAMASMLKPVGMFKEVFCTAINVTGDGGIADDCYQRCLSSLASSNQSQRTCGDICYNKQLATPEGMCKAVFGDVAERICDEFASDIEGKCDCDYSSAGGCKIVSGAQKGAACKCNYRGGWTCRGAVTTCAPGYEDICGETGTSIAHCLAGGGDCEGYTEADGGLWTISVGCAHENLDNQGTKDLISVQLRDWSGRILGRDLATKSGEKCIDGEVKFTVAVDNTDEEVKYVHFSTDGENALYMDRVVVSNFGDKVRQFGALNGKGWCLSKDRGDSAAFEPHLAGKCSTAIRFNISTGRYQTFR
jgi:hypothetical protein